MKPLAERLSVLRAAAAAKQSPADLHERLCRLGSARQPRTRARQPDQAWLAQLLHAERIADGLLRIERRLPIDGLAISAQPKLPALAPAAPLFIDTETTGLSGGSGTLAFLIGCARIESGQLLLRQYLLTRFGGEPTLLRAFAAEVSGAECLVSYNGKSFDLPLLENRFRMTGVENPLASLHHLDLLHWVRRAYGSRWADCRLERVESQLLDCERSDDLPGSQAPAAWFDWIRTGEAGRLPGVIHHNRRDLRSLALLLPELSHVYRDPGKRGADALAVARYHLAGGDHAEALRILQLSQSQLTAGGRMELARLLRREGRLPETLCIWRELAAHGEAAAREQLAKYYEHKVGDYHTALAFAQQLSVDASSRHRCRRLQRKLAAQQVQPRLIAEGPPTQCAPWRAPQ
ncbi:MAG: ribonuclease H-like domain-containing protein [Gammaproteobacteria bacterium]|nr:ribonuclease H-like domain-containing protein [Gammaproteobacteria bacterium]